MNVLCLLSSRFVRFHFAYLASVSVIGETIGFEIKIIACFRGRDDDAAVCDAEVAEDESADDESASDDEAELLGAKGGVGRLGFGNTWGPAPQVRAPTHLVILVPKYLVTFCLFCPTSLVLVIAADILV
jgi:hypothetical protein